MKLSIIVPVYGVEKYIAECIQSFIDNLGRASTEVEVIVVDDGSKDKSIDIAKSIASDYPYFRFLSQTNQGLSMARNNGLEASCGDYVWFVDSDDIISDGIVKTILDAIRRFQTIDMFELKYELVPEDVDIKALSKIKGLQQSFSIITGKERFVGGFTTPVPFHVYRRAFLNEHKLRMYPGIYHEDSEFTPRAVWLAKQVAEIQNVAYYYRQRGKSIMTTPNPQKGENYIFVAHRLQDFFDSQDADVETRAIISDYIAMTYCNGLNNVIGANANDRKRVAKAAYEHRDVLRSLKNAIQMKYRVLGAISVLFPKRTADIYRLMMKLNTKNDIGFVSSK